MKAIKHFFSTTVLLFLSGINIVNAQNPQANIKQEIIGIWVDEDDSGTKLIFSSNDPTYKTGTLEMRFDNSDSDWYDYTITRTSCTNNIVSEYINYLSIKEVGDEFSSACSEIGITDGNILSVFYIQRGKVSLYIKEE